MSFANKSGTIQFIERHSPDISHNPAPKFFILKILFNGKYFMTIEYFFMNFYFNCTYVCLIKYVFVTD